MWAVYGTVGVGGARTGGFWVVLVECNIMLWGCYIASGTSRAFENLIIRIVARLSFDVIYR